MMQNFYRCPNCKSKLIFHKDSISCKNCQANWKIREGIPYFLDKERYWCNFPKEFMVRLDHLAESKGYETAVKEMVPTEIQEHILDEGRADARFFLPITKESIVLDLGCMWGGLTIPIAKDCKEMIAVDNTFETLKFLDIRKRQLNLENIHVAGADALKLPFAKELFDVAILNGVLEWLGYQEDFIVTKDYAKTKRKSKRSHTNPEDLQKQGLKEIYRVLKNKGTVFIAIENRYGYQYFHGSPDDHTGIRFTNLMPRKIANIYMRLRLNQDYRTYTYSYNQHKRNLSKIGFKNIEFYAVFPSYRDPQMIIPLENESALNYYWEYIKFPEISKNNERIMRILLKLGLGKDIVPSFLILAKKEQKLFL